MIIGENKHIQLTISHSTNSTERTTGRRERERESERLQTCESGKSLESGRSDLSRQSSESDRTRGSGVALRSTEPIAARRSGRSRVAGLTHESAVTWHSSAALLALLSIDPGGSLPAALAWNTLDSGKPGSALRSLLARWTSHTQPSYKPPSINQSIDLSNLVADSTTSNQRL